ncbi:MAG TPA: hemerythrin domain-containing protein [Polyangiaceae bacterium]|nr:hemerythrin domain-containing protein [Polyangiaceae bacterium]
MGQTDSFRRQHQEILGLVKELHPQLDVVSLRRDAAPVATGLQRLAAMLKAHLALEDSTLYPKLLAHADPAVADTARRYQEEMGGLQTAFSNYIERWPSASSIQEQPDLFVSQTQQIVAALLARVEREDGELYPMADR